MGQVSTPGADLAVRVRQLFQQARWQEVVDVVQPLPSVDADLDYYYGSALAQLGRWRDARNSLLSGRRIAPRDPRFPIELAGVAFKQQNYPEASAWLRHGLQIDPTDVYANDFLGTVYFLQGNLEAALKYWNRVEKPQIESITTGHPLRIHPALLDRSLTFSPASRLLVNDLLTSKARVVGLGVFVAPNFQVAAQEGGKFDVIMNLAERNGWGANGWEGLLSTFRGLGYETVFPEYFNLGHAAINLTSLVRWDAQKRRVAANISGPLHQNPKWRYSLGIDLRNENWAIRESFTGIAPVLGSLNLRREVADAEITSFNSGRWCWSAGLELSHRDYRSVEPATALTPELLLAGMELKQQASARYVVWRNPDHRLAVSSGASSQLARIWSQPAQIFSKLQGSVSAEWFPEATGDDYETHVQVHGGGSAGSVPFDELYMLGLERDNDLWLRAHIGTRDGRKGSAPLGTRYLLTNADVAKNVYGNGLLSVRVAPFLDTGKITGASGQLGSEAWLCDTGLQATLRIMGVGLTFTWGQDLRTGKSAFYFTSGR